MSSPDRGGILPKEERSFLAKPPFCYAWYSKNRPPLFPLSDLV